MQATARALLDAFFPWSCVGCDAPGSFLCNSCTERVRWTAGPVCLACGLPFASGPAHRCGRCESRPPSFARARAVAYYRAADEELDPLGVAIRALKYSRRRALAAPLSELLAERFPFDPAELDLVVPVPLHVERLRSRGFNQAALLARGPAQRFGLRLELGALKRVRATAAQVGLDERARRRNLRGAFAVAPGAPVAKRRILLVDDVATSTATAEACARALLDAGAGTVDVLTLARTLIVSS